MNNEELERMARQLHEWYLEACRELKPESYNPNAQKAYDEMTEEQKFLDRYIAEKVITSYANSRIQEFVREIDLDELVNEAIVRDEFGGTGKETARIIESHILALSQKYISKGKQKDV